MPGMTITLGSWRQGTDEHTKRKWDIRLARQSRLRYRSHLDVCIILRCSAGSIGRLKGAKVIVSKWRSRQEGDSWLCAVRHRGQQRCQGFPSFRIIINPELAAEVNVRERSLADTHQLVESHRALRCNVFRPVNNQKGAKPSNYVKETWR